jgi:hypothetical protein
MTADEDLQLMIGCLPGEKELRLDLMRLSLAVLPAGTQEFLQSTDWLSLQECNRVEKVDQLEDGRLMLFFPEESKITPG